MSNARRRIYAPGILIYYIKFIIMCEARENANYMTVLIPVNNDVDRLEYNFDSNDLLKDSLIVGVEGLDNSILSVVPGNRNLAKAEILNMASLKLVGKDGQRVLVKDMPLNMLSRRTNAGYTTALDIPEVNPQDCRIVLGKSISHLYRLATDPAPIPGATATVQVASIEDELSHAKNAVFAVGIWYVPKVI